MMEDTSFKPLQGGSGTAGQLSIQEKSERHSRELALIDAAKAIVTATAGMSVYYQKSPLILMHQAGNAPATMDAMQAKEELDKCRYRHVVVMPDSVNVVEMFPGFTEMYRDAVSYLQSRFKE